MLGLGLLAGAEFPDPTAPLERISLRTGEFRTSPTLRDPKSPGEDFPNADQPVPVATHSSRFVITRLVAANVCEISV